MHSSGDSRVKQWECGSRWDGSRAKVRWSVGLRVEVGGKARVLSAACGPSPPPDTWCPWVWKGLSLVGGRLAPAHQLCSEALPHSSPWQTRALLLDGVRAIHGQAASLKPSVRVCAKGISKKTTNCFYAVLGQVHSSNVLKCCSYVTCSYIT